MNDEADYPFDEVLGRDYAPSCKIGEFSRLAGPHDGHHKIFAMLEAYLDESGIHSGAAVCVVAGYFAKAREWRKFERRWTALLGSQLVPLHEFHAKDLFTKSGFFLRWKRVTCDRFIEEVINTICNPGYKIYPVSSGVVVADFQSLSFRERQYCTGAILNNRTGKLSGGCPDKPYFVPFQSSVITIANYAPAGSKVHFYFGLDRDFYKYANDLYRGMKLLGHEEWKSKLGNSSFPLASETPELQAADVLAYLTYTHIRDNIHDGVVDVVEPRDELAFLMKAAKKGRADFTCVTKNSLRMQLDQFREGFIANGRVPPL
jgi:hypothetical protein